ncbi:MAG: ABC transporter substrate binding protein [Desulfocapsaceae bacterium]|nr:ABC transporter substrate binding protein [Desulfocapsaceae bacterium]
MNMKCMPGRRPHLLLLVLLILLVPGWGKGEGVKKNVLFINSYHNGYRWSDQEFEGISSMLHSGPYEIDLQVEYLDAKKYNVEPVIQGLFQVFKKKFADEDFDVVIVSDDDALIFALRFRSALFPGVPIVFCGVNDLRDDQMAQGNLTGVVENFDLGGTIDVALRLHPEKRRMVVIGDESTTGRAIKKQIEAVIPRYKDFLQVDYWTHISLPEAQRRVQTLPDDTFLFFFPYYQVLGNRTYTAEEVMAALYEHSRVPIYTSWEFLLGHGAIGGSMLSGQKHGQEAAAMALKILDGTPADSIPVVRDPAGTYMFDYKVMRHLGIRENLLPAGSIIINSPKAFYELPKELFWTIITSLLLLLVTLVFLVLTMLGRRQVERRIKDQLTFLETLMDTNPQLVSWKNLEYKYLGANRAFAGFFGLNDPGEVISKTIGDVVHDPDYVLWDKGADVAVVNNRMAFRKVRKKVTDFKSQVAWLEVNKVPLRDQTGKIVGILSTAENITRELDLEKQLLQSQKMEAIGTLAGGIAHDFNNILTSIINSTELAIGDVDQGSQTAKDLERVLKAARRGGRVVKQILTFSKPSQEGFRPTDISTVLTEVVGLLEVSLPGNIEMRSSIAPGIGSILADPTQIYQAIMNLCTNAFQALRPAGGLLEVGLEEKNLTGEEAGAYNLEGGTYIILTVADDGPGIPSAIIDKIFDPFFSTKDKTEGTGLGLSVVHGIVKAHQGGLRVDSEEGRGTTFRLLFPRIQAEDDLPRLPEKAVSGSRGGTILFIEDDEDQLLTTPRILRNVGYSVTATGLPQEALALVVAEPGRFELLITDYDMPLINGIELIQRIHAVNPKIPSILISGREDAIRAAQAIPTIRRVFIKPYNTIDLTATINTILEKDELYGKYLDNR